MLYAQPVPVSDFADYYTLAAVILDHGQYGHPAPTALRLPGWPAAMAMLMLVSRSVAWLSLANVVLSTAACGMVYVLATQMTGRRLAGLLAAGGCAVYPAFIFYSPVLASEPLFSVLLLGALIAIMRARRSRQCWRRMALLAGILLGAACLTRGEALVLAPFLAALLVHRRDTSPRRVTFVPAQILLVTLVVTLLPWYLRNLNTMGSGVGLTTSAGINLYYAHNPAAYGYQAESQTPLDNPDEVARHRIGFEAACEYIGRCPWSVCQSALRGTADLYSPPNYSLYWSTRLVDGDLHRRPPKPLALMYRAEQLLLAAWYVLAGLAALSVLTIRRWAPGGAACIALCLLGNWVCNAVITFGSARYRYPIDHLLIIAGAMTIVVGVEWWRKRRERREDDAPRASET